MTSTLVDLFGNTTTSTPCAPCHWCGSAVEVMEVTEDDETRHTARCTNRKCGAEGPKTKREEMAAYLWSDFGPEVA